MLKEIDLTGAPSDATVDEFLDGRGWTSDREIADGLGISLLDLANGRRLRASGDDELIGAVWRDEITLDRAVAILDARERIGGKPGVVVH